MVADGSVAPRLIVTGNPNVGKSVIFQLLTGRYATVSNYPGTTVMVAEGTMGLQGRSVRVSDTPGLNSLQAASEDEAVARDLLLGGGDPIVLQVADAKNLQRAVLLTLELAEAGLRVVLNLNMMDEARERRVAIDVDRLEALLGVPVAPTVATQRQGIERLRRLLPQARVARSDVVYPPLIERAVQEMSAVLPERLGSRRLLALLWLAGDRALIGRLNGALEASVVHALTRIAAEAQERSATRLAALIAKARLAAAYRLTQSVAVTSPSRPQPRLERVGRLAMHPVWGVPILVGVLAVMYVLVGDVAAQRGVGFFEDVVFGRFITPGLQRVVEAAVPWAAPRALLVGEYGLLTMALPYAFAIILPIVTMFFLCFGLIEDVGYLPRLAVMANRACRILGLNGKAVLPMVLGLGCDTMATMTTRILDTKRDRVLVTLLLALGVPCSAQLAVMFAMLAGRPLAALAIWGGVVLAVMVVVGQLASRLIPGDPSPFLYELPPLRRPQLSNVLTKTLGRVEWYIREAVPLFFVGTLLLFVLDAVGILQWLERVVAPLVVGWLGLPAETTAAFLVGFLRRDFGAAGLYTLQRDGALDGTQVVVSLVTITLFVPCIAQYLMMIKERGWRTAHAIAALAFGLAFLVGGLLSRALHAFGVVL